MMPSFGNRRPSPLIAVMVLLGLTMLMMTGAAGAHAATQKAQITVNAQTAGGSTITGMYIELQQGGSDVKAGYTPITFTLTAGQSYQIEADNYGQYSFSQWSSGSTSDPTTISAASGSTTLTAIYGTGSSGGSGSTRGGSSSGPASITVDAQANGNSLNGMYVALLQGGSVINTGYTPVSFSLTAGQSYQVVADNYGQYSFSQWSSGSTSDPTTISAASGSTTLVAMYATSGSSNGGSSSSSTGRGATNSNPPVGGGSSSLGIVIPLYAYPDSVWQSVINYHEEYPSVPMMVVVNPSDGAGSYDSTFASWISTMQGDGITVLGYVDTGYTSYPLSQVEPQISHYVSWYGVHAIFVDDMENVHGYESYYSSLASYAYSNGINFILGNPGTSVTSSYIGIFSNIGTYESPGAPSVSLIQSYTMGYPASGFSSIAYDAGLPSQSYFDSMAQYVSWIYVTDNGASWTNLPSYMSSEMAEIAAA